jgi:hypothetical protein
VQDRERDSWWIRGSYVPRSWGWSWPVKGLRQIRQRWRFLGAHPGTVGSKRENVAALETTEEQAFNPRVPD